MEEFSCNIEHVLQDRDFSILQKFKSSYNNFCNKIAKKVEDTTVYENECIEKRTQSTNKISELQEEIDSLKSKIDAVKLQQKVVDKKITNAFIQEEKLKSEVDEAKLKRDNLSVEMVDLQQESAKRKEHRLLTWSAIKRVYKIYKEYLDFHIQLICKEEHEEVKISFFTNNDDTKDKYCVYLIHSNNQWRVEHIQPVLKMEHLNDLKGMIDFSKQLEISDVTAFLCKLRHTFVKHYLNTGQ